LLKQLTSGEASASLTPVTAGSQGYTGQEQVTPRHQPQPFPVLLTSGK
jgi:hypothetical protein